MARFQSLGPHRGLTGEGGGGGTGRGVERTGRRDWNVPTGRLSFFVVRRAGRGRVSYVNFRLTVCVAPAATFTFSWLLGPLSGNEA